VGGEAGFGWWWHQRLNEAEHGGWIFGLGLPVKGDERVNDLAIQRAEVQGVQRPRSGRLAGLDGLAPALEGERAAAGGFGVPAAFSSPKLRRRTAAARHDAGRVSDALEGVHVGELEDAIAREVAARNAAAQAAARLAAEEAAKRDWYRARPWASMGDTELTTWPDRFDSVLRDALARFGTPARGLIHLDRHGKRRLAMTDKGSLLSRSYQSKVSYLLVDAGDSEPPSGFGSYRDSGRQSSYWFGVLTDGRWAGRLPANADQLKERLVQMTIGR
jgi:hypothetical protein